MTKSDLPVILRDTAGRPVTSSARVTLSERPDGRKIAEAVGRAGQASRFVFTVEAGEYWLDVSASGYAGYSAWVSVGGMTVQTGVVVLEPADEGEEGEGTEGSRITDRIEAFARVRAYPAKEPPPQGRRTALAHKARMLDPDVLNAGLTVQPIEPPLPIVSFGDIGRWVRVSELTDGRPAVLAIGYQEGRPRLGRPGELAADRAGCREQQGLGRRGWCRGYCTSGRPRAN